MQVIRQLQLIMNAAAARMVAGHSKYKHITPVMHDVLHWLLMPRQIQFKVAFHTFNCVRGTGPAYFQHVCIPTANHSGLAGLCSAGWQ